MPKINRQGQAAIWTKPVIDTMRANLNTSQQRLIFEISLWTGERMGAITQLKVSDCYNERGKARQVITFGSGTRKASKHGKAATRQIAIHPVLKTALVNYTPPADGYLFPSELAKSGHISTRAVDLYWRRILHSHGYYGFSTHSSRRWVINRMFQQGTRLKVIAKALAITVSTVERYLDSESIVADLAIASLSI
ncbi:MAG: tyrosine-type recombinase/integrase [Cyanobacteria bacterium J06623_7]